MPGETKHYLKCYNKIVRTSWMESSNKYISTMDKYILKIGHIHYVI